MAESPPYTCLTQDGTQAAGMVVDALEEPVYALQEVSCFGALAGHSGRRLLQAHGPEGSVDRVRVEDKLKPAQHVRGDVGEVALVLQREQHAFGSIVRGRLQVFGQ